MKLRKYQSEGIAKIEAAWAIGDRRVLAVAPTGAGKGTMAVAIILAELERNPKSWVLFVVHRREIVADIRARLIDAGCDSKRVVVASVQSLAKAKRKAYDVVVVDEAHHYRADEWQAVVEAAGKRARIVGFTATPQRSDGRAMGDVFDALVDVVSYSALLKSKPKHIVPCRVLTSPHPLDGALALHSVEAYQRHAEGTPALVFERSVPHARASLKAFKAAGIAAELIIATTSDEQRQAAFERLRTGKTKALINIYVLTEGVDLPWVGTIILARPAKFAGTYIQIAGRALRTHPGKKSALLIDLSGASYIHGSPTKDRGYSLAGRPISEVTSGPVRPRGEAEDKGILGLDLVEFSEDLRDRKMRSVTKFFNWESETRFGKMPDPELAKLLGVSAMAVQSARRQRGIPAFNQHFDWDNERRLGKMPDAKLAELTGYSLSAVKSARDARGITAFMFSKTRDWDSDGRLGKMSDGKLGKILGVTKRCVANARGRRGIPGFRVIVDWDGESRLGKMKDKDLANVHGVNVRAVSRARKRRGITAFNPSADWSKHKHLGKMSDRELASQERECAE